jgi:quercetin dioxygenase-like cupin family protein
MAGRSRHGGDAVIIPPGTSHAISHDSGQPCQVIAVLASADAKIGTTK